MSVSLRLLACASLLAMTAPAFAQAPAMTTKTDKGEALTDHAGMALYTFAKDSDGKSACVDQCAVNWPPLKADADAAPTGDWTLIDRADGSKQWAYKGKPLYAFVKDKKPGEAVGDGLMNGAWKIAQP